jgi:predicted nucleic acid-binding protein
VPRPLFLRTLVDDDMNKEELTRLSTPEERQAHETYRRLQQAGKMGAGVVDETDLLLLAQAIATLVRRNRRLGLIK